MPPPILGDIRCDDSDSCQAADRAFNVKIQRLFPPGTPEKTVIDELVKQQFFCEPGSEPECGRSLLFSLTGKKSFNPCHSYLHVFWSLDSTHRITEITGQFETRCL
jgi:hypothetical protein